MGLHPLQKMLLTRPSIFHLFKLFSPPVHDLPIFVWDNTL